jgi:uncharacterized protein (DUF1015 family)
LPLIRPFRALRPAPGRAAEVLAPPYDVLSSAEARQRAEGRPWSFLHISKPEIDLDAGIDPYDRTVYAKAAENLHRTVKAGVLMREATDLYYVYRLTWRERVQTGLAAVASVAQYRTNRIRKHELTTPVKEDDRVRQIEAVNAQTGPVMMAYPEAPAIDAMLARAAAGAPQVDVTADDGVRHQLWVVDDEVAIDELTRAFDAVPALYIADGHHRSAAAARVAQARGGQLRQDRHPEVLAEGEPRRATAPMSGLPDIGKSNAQVGTRRLAVDAHPSRAASRPPQDDGEILVALASHSYFLSVLFAQRHMTILDYNRVIRDLNGRGADELLTALRNSFKVGASAQPVRPAASNEFGMYLSGRWYRLTLPPDRVPKDDPIGRLPITLLTKNVIEPLFGISDPRTDKRIDFVGGGRGLEGLEARVQSGEMAVAFALYPTQMEDLMAVADAGLIMPPKSTWFEPKLADGMVSHVLD